jgi:hypothetical protein
MEKHIPFPRSAYSKWGLVAIFHTEHGEAKNLTILLRVQGLSREKTKEKKGVSAPSTVR